MSKIPERVAASVSMVAIAATGIAGAQETAPGRTPLEPVPSIQFQATPGTNVLQAFGEGSKTFQDQAERFRDPKQRALIKAEQRKQLSESHRDIEEILELDAATASKLLDLLAEQQTSDQEQFFTQAAARSAAPPGNPFTQMIERAERETAKVQAIRDLIGQEKLERYQAFAPLVNDYRQVDKLNERLTPGDQLSLDQKQRLAELWHKQVHNEIYSNPFSMRLRPFGNLNSLGRMPSREEMQRNSQLMTIQGNEESWRRMPKADAQLRKQASEFLTLPQLDALSQMNTERANNLKKWIEGARAEVGLDPQIPEEPEEKEPRPTPLAGKVKIAVKLTVNGGEATHYTDTVRNGESVTFKSSAGLIVEVRPTVYDDNSFDVRAFYYEPDSRGGRRLIGEGGQMGLVSKENRGGGGGSTVITGNQGYAIELSTQADPV